MVYYIISDSELHIRAIANNLNLEEEHQGKEYLTFNTLDYSFGFIQLISAIWKHYGENPDAVFIINAELKFTEGDERAKYKGVDCALALRLMNKFRNENNIFLTGFSPKTLVEKRTMVEFDNYGFIVYFIGIGG